MEVGTTVQLKNVLFLRGTSDLLDESYRQLDQVIGVLQSHPKMVIELGGHTDNRGDSWLNIKLSKQRVQTVKEYLISQGIEQDRVVGKGYGGTKPIASNKSEETRKLNRRVEFTVLKN